MTLFTAMTLRHHGTIRAQGVLTMSATGDNEDIESFGGGGGRETRGKKAGSIPAMSGDSRRDPSVDADRVRVPERDHAEENGPGPRQKK